MDRLTNSNSTNSTNSNIRTTVPKHKAQLHKLFLTALCLITMVQLQVQLGYYNDRRSLLLEEWSTSSGATARMLANSLDFHRRTSSKDPVLIAAVNKNYSEYNDATTQTLPQQHDLSPVVGKGMTTTLLNNTTSSTTAAAGATSSTEKGVWGIYRLALNGDNDPPQPLSAKPSVSDQEQQLLLPQAVFLAYIRRHSAEALRKDNPRAFRKRKFAIAYYSCPHQLGNRFFHFMNNVLWAMVTDRTILYMYLDKSTCEQLMIAQPMLYLDDSICQAANTVTDCDAVLERASWIPSYEEFADPTWTMHRVDFWQTHIFNLHPTFIQDRYLFDESIHPHMAKVDEIDSKLVEFSALPNMETTDLRDRYTRLALLSTTRARIAARKLGKLGMRFTYGMFFDEMFRLRNQEVDLVKDFYPTANEKLNVFSIALHSRHKKERQRGDYIQNEKDCLNRVLVNRAPNQPCHVCAMSDRPATLKALQVWLEQEHRCQLVYVNHTVPVTSFSIEHGPNAGAAFVRELDVCHRYGRHAVVSTLGASSSALLEALAEYNNKNKYQVTATQTRNVKTEFCNRLPPKIKQQPGGAGGFESSFSDVLLLGPY